MEVWIRAVAASSRDPGGQSLLGIARGEGTCPSRDPDGISVGEA